MGYVAGPKLIIQQMQKLQQYTYVCAPSMAQVGLASAFDVDMSDRVSAYQRKRDMVLNAFRGVAHIEHPGGAFYTFVEVPKRLGMSASAFCEKAIEKNVLIIPGKVFSRRDTHFRLSYAVADKTLQAGVETLSDLMR
jgi:aspartate/methionine/tyrosine aminotransferase